jgi:hypothetical protein
MALQTFWQQVYADLIRELAGTQKRSMLKEFCSRDTKKGETQMFDAVGDPAADATTTALASIQSSRDYFDTLTNPDIADVIKMLTPNTGVAKQRTQAYTQEIKQGKVFKNEDEVAENANNNSMIVLKLLSTIFKAEDALIIGALRAANQLRASVNGKTFANVAFPAGQILGAAGEIVAYTKDVPTAIRAIFETNWEMESTIYCLIHPTTKQELIDQSGDKIQNRDFVEKSEYFLKGRLPEIQGVVHIPHPACPVDEFLAWVPEGIMYNESQALVTKLGEDPGGNFEINLLLREYASSCRLDDRLVVQGQITRGT